MSEERTQKIRDRAHALWEQAGQPHGQDAEHWSQAEREIMAEEDAKSSSSEKVAGRQGRKAKATAEEGADTPSAKRRRSPVTAAEASTEAPATARGRKSKAEKEEGTEMPQAARVRSKAAGSGEAAAGSAGAGGRKRRAAAAGEGDLPKPKQARKPKRAAEGSDSAE